MLNLITFGNIVFKSTSLLRMLIFCISFGLKENHLANYIDANDCNLAADLLLDFKGRSRCSIGISRYCPISRCFSLDIDVPLTSIFVKFVDFAISTSSEAETFVIL